jgi:ABC-type phosphate transport system substrate-binding protein
MRTPPRTRRRAGSCLVIHGGGSTFIAPPMRAWMAAYAGSVDAGARIRYQVVGSGPGIDLSMRGIVDFGVSDAFLDAAQIAAADQPCARAR